MFKKLALSSLAALAMTATTGASGAPTSYINRVVVTDGGHRIGNSEAKVSVTEFVSYTCPACANFVKDGDGALELGYVSTGKVTMEIRHIIRDPVDLTAAMLTNCGAVSKFPQNHKAFMLTQAKWLPLIGSASKAQRNRWFSGTNASRRRAIASDMGFYPIMERRGYRRTQIDQCLANEAKATSMAETSQKDSERYFISGTPSFALNGVTLAGTHSWSLLEPQIKARLP